MTPSPHQSELNKRLRDIFNERDGYIHKTEANELAIAQIHKAFTDAGYRHNLAAGFWSKELEREGYMTGQEWYERFEKELEKDYEEAINHRNRTVVNVIVSLKEAILDTAKRAAGLDT